MTQHLNTRKIRSHRGRRQTYVHRHRRTSTVGNPHTVDGYWRTIPTIGKTITPTKYDAPHGFLKDNKGFLRGSKKLARPHRP